LQASLCIYLTQKLGMLFFSFCAQLSFKLA
jgi:hypothetical protein